MPTQTSVNEPVVGQSYGLFPPRNAGRGVAIKSTGLYGAVSWNGSGVYSDDVFVFSLSSEPYFLDVAYDQLDRPQISYQLETGESFLYFYNGLISDYQTLSLGFDAIEPILCNDYLLGGSNTVLAYLKGRVPTYRLQADRFSIEHTLIARGAVGIKALGYGTKTNSIQIIVGRWR